MRLSQYLLLLIIASFSCKSESAKTQQTENTEEELSEVDIRSLLQANSNMDTLSTSGKTIVFFTISQPEIDVYPKGPNSGIDEVLSDFEYYSNQAADSLEKFGYKLAITASRFVRFEFEKDSIFVFDRLSTPEHVVGRVYADRTKIKVSYGVATDIDIYNEFEEFKK